MAAKHWASRPIDQWPLRKAVPEHVVLGIPRLVNTRPTEQSRHRKPLVDLTPVERHRFLTGVDIIKSNAWLRAIDNAMSMDEDK